MLLMSYGIKVAPAGVYSVYFFFCVCASVFVRGPLPLLPPLFSNHAPKWTYIGSKCSVTASLRA